MDRDRVLGDKIRVYCSTQFKEKLKKLMVKYGFSELSPFCRFLIIQGLKSLEET